MKYFVKVITGFREDQYHSIPMQDAHKAYYLFKNPDKRGVFDNGLAIVGSQIREIQPDYHATMGWNPAHKLTADDYKEIKLLGVQEKMNILMEKANTISSNISENPELLQQQLGEIIKSLPEEHNQISGYTDDITDSFRIK